MNSKRLKNLKRILIVLGILIITFLIVYVLYVRILPQKKLEWQIRNMIEEYMEKKYGNQNFKAKYIQKNYHYTEFSQILDFSDKHFVGYTVTVTSNAVPETYVFIKGTELGKMTMSDSFLEDYYAVKAGLDRFHENYIFDKYYNWEGLEKEILQGEIPKNKCERFKKYLYNKSELIYEIKINNNDLDMSIDIPEDLGHIPTKGELGEFAEIRFAEIKANVKENDKEMFMQELRKHINEYFNNTKDVKISSYNNESYNITLNDKE